MKKLLVVAAFAAPALLPSAAHATHPFQGCEINIDLAATAKPLGGGVTQAVIRYAYDWSMTPYGKPEEKETVGVADGAAPYKHSTFSSLYERRLASVEIEFFKDSSAAAPSYKVSLAPLNDPDEKKAKGAPVVCRTGAD